MERIELRESWNTIIANNAYNISTLLRCITFYKFFQNLLPLIHLLIYYYFLLQCSLMFIMACAGAVTFHTQMGAALILMTKYNVLAHELSNLKLKMLDDENVYGTTLYKTIQKCAQSHHHILRSVEGKHLRYSKQVALAVWQVLPVWNRYLIPSINWFQNFRRVPWNMLVWIPI